jgi:hypothetical protein
MAAAIYSLCAITCLVCAVLLLRAYARSKTHLLLWSGLCFAGLTANNALLVVDRIVLPLSDLSTLRLAVAFLALMLLLFGLIWEGD